MSEHLFPLPILLFACFLAVVIVVGIYSYQAEKKRRAALLDLATRLGLSFLPDRDRNLAARYAALSRLHEGGNRYALNVLSGTLAGHPTTAFDFHYETYSTDDKGNTQTTHHHLHVIVLRLERTFPKLMITPEGILSKIAQAFGYDDIDFESHEFSRRFCVRSPDRKFAYDFCNARMIELLLANIGLHVEVLDDSLALIYSGRMDPAKIEPELDLARTLRERMPDYLFTA
jgi:hypothetical protein